MERELIGNVTGRLRAACALLAVVVGLLGLGAGCALDPASAPTEPAPSAATTQAESGPAVDARELVITEADLGPGWRAAKTASQPSVTECASRLEWSGSGGELSPEGLSAVSSQVVVHPDAASALAAMLSLDAVQSEISGPRVGDTSRTYTRTVNGGSSAVYLEAVQDSVWLRVGVYGDARSEVKVTRAAQLAEMVLARLPAALTVEEYPIADAATARPDRIEYSRLIDRSILEKRQAWREPGTEARVAATNAVLAPFGYRVAIDERATRPGGPCYTLFEGESEIVSDIAHFGEPSVATDGSDFAMVLEPASAPSLLLRNGSMEEWDAMRHAMTHPVLVGSDLVAVVMDSETPQQAGRQAFAVTRDGEVVYRFDAQFAVDNPIKGLWAWDGRWVLEVASEVMTGEVVVDGESLNRQMGYDEVFEWRLLRGEPFYFFSKDGEVGLSHAGRELPVRYEEVIHYQCCEPAAFNVRGNGDMVWFHALRDGTWYYVKAGVYGPAARGGSGAPGPGAAVDATVKAAPALSSGTLAEAEAAVGVSVRLPGHLPDGAEQEGPVRFHASGPEGMISIEYRAGQRVLALQYLRREAGDDPSGRGEQVAVGEFTATLFTRPKEPSDPFPPTSEVRWRDGGVEVRVTGDLPRDELLAVARSMY